MTKGKEVAVYNPNPIAIKEDKKEIRSIQVEFEKLENNIHQFTCKTNDGIEIVSTEASFEIGETDFVQIEFENAFDEEEKAYYLFALASGIITGALSHIELNEEQLDKINEWKKGKWEPLVINIAKLDKYKGKSYKGAVAHLRKHIEKEVCNNEEVREKLQELSSHPSLAGLVFSIYTQFSGRQYYFNEKEELDSRKVKKYYVIGDTFADKIIFGMLYWLFNLALCDEVTKQQIIYNIDLPKKYVELIQQIVSSDVFKNISENFGKNEEEFSNWIKTKFEKKASDDDELKGTLEWILEKVKDTINDSPMVLVNECLFRGFYVLKRLHYLAQQNGYRKLSDIYEISAMDILPFNNRIVSHMSLIASASFATVNISGALLKAVSKKKKGNEQFAQCFFNEVNIAGVGRFVLAVSEDWKYITDDIKLNFTRKKELNSSIDNQQYENSAFAVLSLNEKQARLLHSLETLTILGDVNATKKEDVRKQKERWLDIWQNGVLLSLNENDPRYFVTEESALYEYITSLSFNEEVKKKYYLLAMDLSLFEMYEKLGVPEDKSFKKLKVEHDYIENDFVRKQNILIQKDIDDIRKNYKKYYNQVNGSNQNKVVVAGAAVVAAVAMGGAAFVFAPQIAIALAGEAVAGLHGIALVNGSLALIGGGAIAAGGLGVAGGTAIITGGGAMLGMLCSSTVSTVAVLSQAPSEYWAKQCAELTTYSDILCSKFNDKVSVQNILGSVKVALHNVEQEVEALENEKNDLDKPMIKNAKECMRYLKKTETILSKMVK